nr:hypothetical protein [Clostridia bacterium]
MSVSVADVMRHINNYFEVGCLSGLMYIDGNAVIPAPEAPWCYISGSWMHEGVWQLCDGRIQDMPGNLPDEEFDGRVWLLKPPPDFLALCARISEYDDKNPAGALMTEKFGDYSYSRRSSASSYAWEDVFAKELRPYRRPFTEVS